MEIGKKRLEDLLDIEKRMLLLEAGGIDNWEGYDIAMEPYEAEKEILYKIDDLVAEILEEASMHIEVDVAGPGTGHGLFPESNDATTSLIVEWLKENTTIFN